MSELITEMSVILHVKEAGKEAKGLSWQVAISDNTVLSTAPPITVLKKLKSPA